MKGDKSNVDREAIQFHLLVASDGCLLSVGKGNLLKGSSASSNFKTSEEAQAAFMSTIQNYQKEDKMYSCSSDIKVSFDRLHDNAYYEQEKVGSIDNKPVSVPNSFTSEIAGIPTKKGK